MEIKLVFCVLRPFKFISSILLRGLYPQKKKKIRNHTYIIITRKYDKDEISKNIRMFNTYDEYSKPNISEEFFF